MKVFLSKSGFMSPRCEEEVANLPNHNPCLYLVNLGIPYARESETSKPNRELGPSGARAECYSIYNFDIHCVADFTVSILITLTVFLTIHLRLHL